MAERRPAPVPAVLVSGFLGAGKTTLLNGVLAGLAGRRVAIVENEVGDEPLDGDLLNAPREQIVELAGGCLCCTVQGQLADALGGLAARADEFDLLLVETSGVADLAPVIRVFQAAGVRAAFRLNSLITVVDAVNSVACADLVPAACGSSSATPPSGRSSSPTRHSASTPSSPMEASSPPSGWKASAVIRPSWRSTLTGREPLGPSRRAKSQQTASAPPPVASQRRSGLQASSRTLVA